MNNKLKTKLHLTNMIILKLMILSILLYIEDKEICLERIGYDKNWPSK